VTRRVIKAFAQVFPGAFGCNWPATRTFGPVEGLCYLALTISRAAPARNDLSQILTALSKGIFRFPDKESPIKSEKPEGFNMEVMNQK